MFFVLEEVHQFVELPKDRVQERNPGADCGANRRHVTVTHFSAHKRLGLESKSDRMENNSHPCAQRTLHPFCVVFHACMVAEQVFLELGY